MKILGIRKKFKIQSLNSEISFRTTVPGFSQFLGKANRCFIGFFVSIIFDFAGSW